MSFRDKKQMEEDKKNEDVGIMTCEDDECKEDKVKED